MPGYQGEARTLLKACHKAYIRNNHLPHVCKWLNSYRNALLYNQWCSVVRWEKTQAFLRTSEFLWQEGHTLHETEEEAQAETLQMLDIYRQLAEDLMAMPVLLPKRKRKICRRLCHLYHGGLMHDGQALQAGIP